MKIIKCGAESGIVQQKANPLESHENREMFTVSAKTKENHDTVLNKINQVLNKKCGLLRMIADLSGPLRPLNVADRCARLRTFVKILAQGSDWMTADRAVQDARDGDNGGRMLSAPGIY